MRSAVLSFCTLLCCVMPARAQEPMPAFRTLRSWSYQLDNIRPDVIAASNYDLVVIDYSADGSDERAFTSEELTALHRKPDGSRRLVLAYLSIGEAEDYRFYWQREWRRNPPPWLDAENPDWPGNYKVHYWEAGWQRLIFGSQESYLDRILRAGFDGVYLDIIDAYEYYEENRPQATREMIEFVRRISEYAKSRRAGGHFLVVGQNGEALAEHADYLAAIDGIAKEDLYYGYSGAKAFTPANETEYSEAFLLRARDAGKLILTVDYTTDPAHVATIYQRARARGFVPYATVRNLDRIVVNPGWDPAFSRSSSFPTRRLPGQFFALTAPRGAFRLSLVGDYWREKFTYSASDFVEGADDASFEAESFYELTYNLVLGYGLSDSWEIGLRAPVVSSRLERDHTDGLSGLKNRLGGTGIGDLHLVLAHSRSADAGARNLLAALELGLMTDSRAAPFGGGNGDAAFTLTAERYWDAFGIIGTASATHYFGDQGSGGESVLAASGGIGLQLTNALYASLLAGLENDAPRVEFSAEHLLGERRSLEFYVGGDLSGGARAAFAGIAINFWIAR